MASVLELVKYYQHAIEKYPDDEQRILKCINMLSQLDVTVGHLQETGVGRTVNALRKEPGTVGQAARSLVNAWKRMVAAEESDQEEDYNDSAKKHNGHGQDKDSYNNTEGSRMKTEDASCKQINGDHSGTKRKYQSSEDEEQERKKSRHIDSSSQNGFENKPIVKKEPKSESDYSDSSESDSESSEEETKPVTQIKTEPPEPKAHSHSSKSDYRNDSSSKTSHESSKHHKSESRHSSDKSSSRDKSTSKHRSSSVDKKTEHKKSDKDKKLKDEARSGKHASSSDKPKSTSDERNKPSEKSSSKSENHDSSKSHKSDKHKHKSSSEKETSSDKHKSNKSSSKDKHSSSSKDKSKDSSSSSKDKSSHSKSDKHAKQSRSSESKSEKTEHKSSQKSKHRSSSSKSSSKHKEDIPKKKSKSDSHEDSDEGIGCESGASFAEALGMISPAKPKKKVLEKLKDSSPVDSWNEDLSPASLLAPTAVLAPLPKIEISSLPEISANYKPRPPPKFLPHFTDEEAMSASISSKNQRTKVYSGNKIMGKVPSLYDLCVQVLQEHIDALEYTGGVPYEILKPVVDKATPQQLFVLEHYNPYLMDETDHLWQAFCEKHFRNKRRQEMETWREMYARCQEEQETKLRSLTENIKIAQEAKKAPIKQTKMAYVDAVVKPPRNIARKQAIHGTAHVATASPAARVAALAAAANVLRGGVRAPPAPAAPAAALARPKKAPLMQKALQFMRGRKR